MTIINSLDTLAQTITQLQHNKIIQWQQHTNLTCQYHDLLGLVEQNHAFNFQLWNQEDLARRDDQGFEYVYNAKRAIDALNQKRNDCIEQIDAWLYQLIQPSQTKDCIVHSETPGMIIDRLSILALKCFHMELQSQRQTTIHNHQQHCKEKYKILLAQREQLGACLQIYFAALVAKTHTFKIYHQFKMYNDPQLNPALYTD